MNAGIGHLKSEVPQNAIGDASGREEDQGGRCRVAWIVRVGQTSESRSSQVLTHRTPAKAKAFHLRCDLEAVVAIRCCTRGLRDWPSAELPISCCPVDRLLQNALQGSGIQLRPRTDHAVKLDAQ